MFSVLKVKLQSVQENISSSFRGLKVQSTSSNNSEKKLPVDLNAGADLLQNYQTEWQELHLQAEENANAAQIVDVSVMKLHNETSRQWQAAEQLTSALSSLPQLVTDTEAIVNQLEHLQDLITAVEDTLLELADTVEKKELVDRQIESQYKLAVHMEQGLASLDTLRAKLSKDHREKVINYEKEFEKKQKERQEIFAKVFEEDLQTYKQTGKIPTIRSSPPAGLSLEEVELDSDTEALNKLLEE